MSNYFQTFEPLNSPQIDGELMKEFLSLQCQFAGPDIVWIKNEISPEKIAQEFQSLNDEAKKTSKGNDSKFLVFVYYSGHGTIDQNGSTQGHTINGTSFNIESSVRNLATFPNTAVIALLDCCRVEHKGFVNVTQKVGGQLALIHAAQSGKQALGGTKVQCSLVTRDFLTIMRNTSLTFPLCIQDWAKSHKMAQLSDKMAFEIPLKEGTALASSIPDSVSCWSSENLIAWLRSIHGLRGIDEYAAIISKPENGYDGNWIFRRKTDEEKLSTVFTKKADVEDIMDDLEKWIKNHPQ